MKKILLICSNAEDATSWYRGVGPFSLLQKTYSDISVTVMEPSHCNKWSLIAQFNLVVFQRPCTSQHLEVATLIKSLGIPLILDYDDNHFDIQLENDHYTYFVNNKGSQKKIMNMADHIICSTDHLKESLSKEISNRAMTVINNGIIPNWKDIRDNLGRRDNSVFYRGSKTHLNDLLLYKDAVQNGINTLQEDFIFQGFAPFFLTGTYRVNDPMPLHKYFNYLKSSYHKLFFVPLKDCGFNRSKSNIALLEATMNGANCLAPDWEEWRIPGVILYGDFNDGLVNFRFDVERSIEQRRYVQEHYNLLKLNTLRRELINRILQ